MEVTGIKTFITRDVRNLCDERIDLKKRRYEAQGAKEYRKLNKRIQKAVKKTKDDGSVLSARTSKLA